MKALFYKSPGVTEYGNAQMPANKEGCALLRVKYCGICGSDLSIAAGKHPRAKAPLIMGHEFSAVIEQVADNSYGFEAGDRVVLNPLVSCGQCHACKSGNPHVCGTLKLIGIDYDGGMAEYVSAPLWSLVKTPDALPDDIAALIEPLAVCVHGIRESRVNYLENVLITGAGPIGLLTAVALKSAGTPNIYISEVNDFRLDMARSFGINVIDAKTEDVGRKVGDVTGGEGMDVVFEASGAAPIALSMTDYLRPRGVILMLAIHKDPHPVDLRAINFKEIKMVGSRVYTRLDVEAAVKYAVEIKETLARFVTHRLPVEEGAKAFELAADIKANALKVLIDCR